MLKETPPQEYRVVDKLQKGFHHPQPLPNQKVGSADASGAGIGAASRGKTPSSLTAESMAVAITTLDSIAGAMKYLMSCIVNDRA